MYQPKRARTPIPASGENGVTTRRRPVHLDRIITRTIIPLDEDEDSYTVSAWAGRVDFTARDTLTFTVSGGVNVHDTRFYVADVPGGTPWTVGDTFQDAGARYTVRGIAQLPDVRQLELLVRTFG